MRLKAILPLLLISTLVVGCTSTRPLSRSRTTAEAYTRINDAAQQAVDLRIRLLAGDEFSVHSITVRHDSTVWTDTLGMRSAARTSLLHSVIVRRPGGDAWRAAGNGALVGAALGMVLFYQYGDGYTPASLFASVLAVPLALVGAVGSALSGSGGREVYLLQR